VQLADALVENQEKTFPIQIELQDKEGDVFDFDAAAANGEDVLWAQQSKSLSLKMEEIALFNSNMEDGIYYDTKCDIFVKSEA